MTVRTLFFATYRDLAGSDGFSVTLPDGSRAADLVSLLRARGGGLGALPEAPAIAINMRYAPLSTPLTEDDEVAFIPPVAGG